jgi:transcriptional regulator GlxA family with amidase domain
VQTIALRCGFADVRRFAALYELAFGEPPSRTLDRDGR